MRPEPAASPEREFPLDGAPFSDPVIPCDFGSGPAHNLFVEFRAVFAHCVYEYVCLRSRVIVVIFYCKTKCIIVDHLLRW